MTQGVVHLQRQLKELEERLKHSPTPTYAFRSGERVRVGVLQDVVVEEVLHEGHIYLIDYTSVESNYGKSVRNEHQKKYVSWMQVRKFMEEQKESVVQNADLNLRFTYRMLSELFNKVYHFGVRFDVENSCGVDWGTEDKELLIDSIFGNIDIGKFAFIQYDAKTWVKSGYGFELLDGRQRLRAILDFYEDRFAWRGITFSELTSRDQNHFLGYPVLYAETKEMPRDKRLRNMIQLNSFGKVLGQDRIDQLKERLESETR